MEGEGIERRDGMEAVEEKVKRPGKEGPQRLSSGTETEPPLIFLASFLDPSLHPQHSVFNGL